MLAHFGGDVGVLVLGQRIEPLDGILRHDDVGVLAVLQAVARAPAVDLLPPGVQRLLVERQRLGLPHADHVFQRMGHVADDRNVDPHRLVDRGRVDVDVDLLRARREGIEAAGDAVVEARADVDHHVAVVHRHVGFVRAVHAEHAEPVLARRRIGAKPHQRRGDRDVGERHEFAQQLRRRRPGIDHAAAGIEHRALGRGDQLDRGADGVLVGLHLGPVGLVLDVLGADILAGGELHVLRNVDHDRAGTAVGGDIEGLVQDAGEIVHVLHQIIVLGAGPRDADRVAFLEGVVADEMGRHLAGEADHGDRIHQRVGEAGHRIGGAGAGGDQHHAALAGGAGIAFRRMGGALLVADEDVLDLLLLEDLVIDRQDRAAGIAEDMLDPLVGQRLQHDLGTRHLIRGHRKPLYLCPVSSNMHFEFRQ